ncbi:MAG: DPP IV N-terminal domain-containing protein [Bacteroidales bacterium]|nr:MAG: DPP IV N-terminal domain-containing protein [Bacteroidales bacterium]
MKTLSLTLILYVLVVSALPVTGQQKYSPESLTADDYNRAEKFLSANTSELVFGASVRPSWIDTDRFWYRNSIPAGSEFIIVDARKRTRAPAFDHEKLAAALTKVTGETHKAFDLPFSRIEFSDDGRYVTFNIRSQSYTYDIKGNTCTADEAPEGQDRNSVVSPDGKKAAFIRDYNLWIRDLSTGTETQLTKDGMEDFGYATNNAGWTRSDQPVLLWSPDSKKIATFQHDGRGVGEMYLVTTNVGHPTLEAWKYPLPEDSVIFRIHRVVIHIDGPRVVRLRMAPDQHRSSLCDHVVCRGSGWADIEWSPDGSRLAFVSTSRDHKHEVLRIADPETGTVRDIMEERVETFFESGYGKVNWNVLFGSEEVIWYSERDNWGHLYLYDLGTGELKNRITTGSWKVLQVLHIDRENRIIYFTAAGKESGDPYFQYFYRIGMDGSKMQRLTPEPANHSVSLSPEGRYFTDSYSTPTEPPVSVLRDAGGERLLTLEEADISRLIESGWVPPVPFTVRARDGVTDLYGLMHKPSNFDPNNKYPIINYIYPGPQSGSVGSRSYAASRGDRQCLAELGFIVVAIDAMGTPGRSKSFHEAYYGNMGDNGLPDQITGMKQLAEQYSWIDIDRVGIYGHSGGGFASTDAILRYPDFFKVAVSRAGNHDNRNYEDDWGEKWQGLLETYPDGTTNYDNQANQLLAKNLKGKLLLAHGTMDSNVPMYNTLLVVNDLIAANKDFDLILFPNRGHGFGNEPYMMRRRWDYFVKHLLGAEPPKEYEFKSDTSRRRPLM